MNTVLILGLCLGALAGVAHARVLLMMSRSAPAGGAGVGSTVWYRALWTVLLWTLFGTYLLVLWALATVAYGVRGLRDLLAPAKP